MTREVELRSTGDLVAEMERRIALVDELLVKFEERLGTSHPGQLASLRESLDGCRSQLLNPPPVSIALLGGTGAGKSTLVNALIGATVLPTSAISVCTSAITRVRFANSPMFTATVNFVPKETWGSQVDRLVDDIRAAKEIDSNESGYSNEVSIPEDEARRIQAVYGESAVAQFRETGDRASLVEPDWLVEAFAARSKRIECANTDDLRKSVAVYLTSKEHYWPIVKSCEIEGPFEGFDHGGEIVDLPGLNDPNEAREEMTRNYLESARFVCVVFNMKRALGKDLTDVLKSRDLLNRLMAGGRLSSMTFVGTHSDDVSSIDPGEYGLSEDAELSEIALKRNELAEEELRSCLRQVATSINATASSDAHADAIVATLMSSPAFMVSASNYLQIIGARSSKGQAVFSDRYETNVPQLAGHLRKLSIEAGPKANAFAMTTTVEGIVATLGEIVQAENARLKLSQSNSSEVRSRLATQASSLSKSLATSAEESIRDLERSLQAAVDRFNKGSAIDREAVTKVIARTTASWSATHWATMRATAVRGGRFASPTRGEIDLIRDLGAPVIKHSMIPWTDFFENDLPRLARSATESLRSAVQTYTAGLLALKVELPEIAEILDGVIPEIAADAGEAVDAALAVANQAIEQETAKRQQELHRITEESIVTAMKPVFVKASIESGTGMKQRMNDHLSSGSAMAVRKACESVESRLAASAKDAVNRVLTGLDPVAERIAERGRRTAESLGQQTRSESASTSSDLIDLIARVNGARGEVSVPIRFVGFRRSDSTDPTDRSEAVPDAAMETSGSTDVKAFVFVDASNVARVKAGVPDVALLESCLESARENFPEHRVTLIGDASLHRLVQRESGPEQFARLEVMIAARDLVLVPPGSPGKADKYMLQLADKKDGIIVSNDSFKEFQPDFPWLFEEGRLFGHSEIPEIGWQFTVRFPVRPRSTVNAQV